MKRALLLVLLTGFLTACVAAGPEDGPTGAEPSPSPVGGLGAGTPVAEGIVLGRTSDELGQPHSLVLNLAPGMESMLQTDEMFAVVSGSTMFSVSGDAAVGAWRFTVDSGATGDSAPIVVIKNARGSVEALARDPAKFTAGVALNEDVGATSARLSALIATAISNAKLADGSSYAELARVLQDPTWTGVLVFNASVSAAPEEVQGQTIGALIDLPIAAFNIGFETSPLSGSTDAFFGTIDYSPASSSAVRARFDNSALSFFETGIG